MSCSSAESCLWVKYLEHPVMSWTTCLFVSTHESRRMANPCKLTGVPAATGFPPLKAARYAPASSRYSALHLLSIWWVKVSTSFTSTRGIRMCVLMMAGAMTYGLAVLVLVLFVTHVTNVGLWEGMLAPRREGTAGCSRLTRRSQAAYLAHGHCGLVWARYAVLLARGQHALEAAGARLGVFVGVGHPTGSWGGQSRDRCRGARHVCCRGEKKRKSQRAERQGDMKEEHHLGAPDGPRFAP